MTRKKVKLAFITSDSSRKATYKKRKKGLMKKVSELSTLCGIDACAIIYSPYDAQPEVWPDARGAHRVLAQFKRMPEMEQSKKMVNQESFIRNRISKAADQLKKLHKDNREKEITHLMYQCLTGKGLQGLPLPDLNDMGWLVDQNLKDIYKRIEALKKEAVAAPAPPPDGNLVDKKEPVAATVEMGVVDRQQQWFTDWIGMNPVASDNQHQIGGCSFASGGGGGSGSGSGGGGTAADEIMMAFNDGNNNHGSMWSSVFFP